MVRSHKGRKGSKPRKSARRAVEPSDAAIMYKGPIWDPLAWSQRDRITINLSYHTTISSNAGGVLNNTFDQSMTGLTDWADYAVLWDEYRVLGCQLEFYPNNRYSKVTVTCTPGVGIIDRDSNASLTTISQGFGYASSRILTLEDAWADKREYKANCVPPLTYRMAGIVEAEWLTTAAPVFTTRPTIKLYFSGLTASTSYGLCVQRMLIQFRGRI